MKISHVSVQIQLKEYPPFSITSRSTNKKANKESSPASFSVNRRHRGFFLVWFWFCFISVAQNHSKPMDWETQISAPRSPVNRIITRNCHLSGFLITLHRARALPKHGPCFYRPSVATTLEFNFSSLLGQQITQYENCRVHSGGKWSLFYEMI